MLFCYVPGCKSEKTLDSEDPKGHQAIVKGKITYLITHSRFPLFIRLQPGTKQYNIMLLLLFELPTLSVMPKENGHIVNMIDTRLLSMNRSGTLHNIFYSSIYVSLVEILVLVCIHALRLLCTHSL